MSDNSIQPRTVALGVVVPSFNTTVEDEYADLRPPHVRHYVSRIRMPDTTLLTDEEQAQVVVDAVGDLDGALRAVSRTRPDAIALGISIPAFWEGRAGAERLRRRCEDAAGCPVATAADAVREALATLPPQTRLGVVTPYRPEANRRVAAFVEECGVPVAGVASVEPPRSFDIARVTSARLKDAVRQVATEGATAVLQVGTNLRTPREVGEWTDAPVFTINRLVHAMALRLAVATSELTHP
ncbi:hypothetical protein [Nocardia sp. NPDC024068]|uniref:maleate cis-trans isomerase family protein n=1 Tax=Nocardia sp. NPDC024068 TaxID=3157197 RepID=UPI0033CAB2D1